MTELARQPTLRKEDRRLLVGEGRFGADVQFPRMLHARIVRSAVACGRLTGIDTAAARAIPGVVAVFTAADLPGDIRIPVRLQVQAIERNRPMKVMGEGRDAAEIGRASCRERVCT